MPSASFACWCRVPVGRTRRSSVLLETSMPMYLSILAWPTHLSVTRSIAPTRPVLADAGSRPRLRSGLEGIGCGVPALLRARRPSPCRTAAPRPRPNGFGCNTPPFSNIQVPTGVGFGEEPLTRTGIAWFPSEVLSQPRERTDDDGRRPEDGARRAVTQG